MKFYSITKQELIEFLKDVDNETYQAEAFTAALVTGLKTWGAQAEYLTALINDWMTAFTAEKESTDKNERRIFHGSRENAARYMLRLLQYKTNHSYISYWDLDLYLILGKVWERFK